jgi:hypothetical protein
MRIFRQVRMLAQELIIVIKRILMNQLKYKQKIIVNSRLLIKKYINK